MCCGTASLSATKPKRKRSRVKQLSIEFSRGYRCRDRSGERKYVIPSEAKRSRGTPWHCLAPPMTHQNYFVYMLTNADRHTVFYIGITNNLERRAGEHSLGWGSAFARKYHANKLVYFEAYADPRSAIEREKQLKTWSRAKKY